jgi:hypothetical protein
METRRTGRYSYGHCLAGCQLVLSSRPTMACKAAFEHFPGLQLQDLTKHDITFYVSYKLNQEAKMREIRAKDKTQVETFISDIVTKAQGVFLWIMLVDKSLVRGLQNHDSLGELKKRLDECPPELEDLYNHTLKRMEPLYHQQAARYFNSC